MTPLDIEPLNWKDFRRNSAVDAAYNDLMPMADRPVLLHDKALVPKVPKSFRTAWSGGIHIFIDLTAPRRDHSLVHELLHEILSAEGYCYISGIPRYQPMARDAISNEMQHPEIFSRMEHVYHLEMDSYWEHWHTDMRREVDTMKDQARDSDYWLGHFPRVYTWFFQEIAAPYLAEYAQASPRVYRAVEAAANETKGIGFSTHQKHRQCMEIFREHWLRFCERNLPRDYHSPPPHALIEATVLKRVIERDKATTADDLMNLLRNLGFKTS